RPRLVDETLREIDPVAVADRDRRRTGEERTKVALPGLLGRPREEAVLHDVVLDAARAQPAAQLLELTHLEPAVFGDDERDRPGELFCETFDLLCAGAVPLQPHRLSTDGAVPLQPPGLGTCSYELNDRVQRRRIAIRRVDLKRRGAEVDLELLSARPLLLEDLPVEMHWVPQTSGAPCGEALPAECLRRAAEHDPRICDASQIPKPRRRAIAVKVRFEDHRRPARERAYRDGP